MSQKSTFQTRQKNTRLSVNSFNGIKMNANEPWLYSIWYLITSGLPGFLSGILWSPLAIAWFGTFYSPISQSIVLNPAGELFRDGAQIITGLFLYIAQFVGMYRIIMKGHGKKYLIQTIRFKGDEYTIIPLVVNHIEDYDSILTDIPFHKSLISVSIPYPLATMFKIRNIGISIQKTLGFAKNKNYWDTYQPFDQELMIHEGSQKDTFRYHEGKVPYMNVLLMAPDTLPLGTSVYFDKQYGKVGTEKRIPVMFIHDSPFSTEQVLKLGGLKGLTNEELNKADEQFDAYKAREKDEQIEELERENVRLEASLTAEQTRKDKEIAEDRQWVGGGLDDEPVNKAASRLFSRGGLVALGGFTLAVVAILLMLKAHWIG